MRWLLLAGVAIVAVIATRVWVWTETWDVPAVPLTSGLPRETAAMTAAFDARVKSRFQVGAAMAEVGLELARENFVRQDWTSLPNEEHFARRYDGGAPVCDRAAVIIGKQTKVTV